MGAYNGMDAAFAGLAFGIDKKVGTSRCADAAGLPFGRAVMAYSGDADGGYGMKQDELTLTFSADLVSLNSVALTINGVALSPVVYATSHANTMNLIKAAIEAAFPTATVSLPDIGTTNRKVKVFIKGTVMSGSGVVTLGASQATITASLSSQQVFRGVSLHVHKEYAGAAQYNQNEAMNVVEDGQVWVEVTEAVKANDKAYVVQSGAGAGKFATSGYDCGCKFRSNTSGAGLALVEIFGTYDGI